MGTASSVTCNTIYISKDVSCNEYINTLHEKLKDKMYSSIYQSQNIIIVISPNTIRSVQQITEINHAWESQKPIIYLMIDESYTPICNPEVQSIVKNHKWFPCFDEETMNQSFIEIIRLFI